MRIAILLFTFFTCLSARAQTPESPVVVLVPGFFNTLIPSHVTEKGWVSYFSTAIINAIESRGYTVVLADSLMPIAPVAQNGELLKRFLLATMDRFKGRRMVLITHSAGGLYAMEALTLRPDLPIDAVVTLATPYRGVEFVDRLNEIPGLDSLAHFLHLEGLRQFRPALMTQAIENFTIPEHIRWIAVAGTQPSCFGLSCADAKHLSWLLSLTQSVMSEPSDGVITWSSALGIGMDLRHPDGTTFQMERWTDFNFALEHWEMVEESHLFATLGVVNTGTIRRLQTQFMGAMLDRLEATHVLTAPDMGPDAGLVTSSDRAPLSQPKL